MFRFLFLFLILFFSLSTHAELTTVEKEALWNAHPNFKDTQIFKIPATTDFATVIPITLIQLKNSTWTLQEIEEKIRRTELIFSQCQWSFDITLIHTVHVEGATIDINDVSYLDISSLHAQGALVKPVVFLLDAEIKDRYEGGASMRAGLFTPRDPEYPLRNTSVLFRHFALEDFRSYNFTRPQWERHYEVLAHELSHLLFDQSHLMYGIADNIMSEQSLRTNDIEPYQCLLYKPDRFL
jgi:hypothetical protein